MFAGPGEGQAQNTGLIEAANTGFGQVSSEDDAQMESRAPWRTMSAPGGRRHASAEQEVGFLDPTET
jgi:hypothetical protein